jgi:hypothetical protein
MWARAEGIGTILTNAAGSCVARLCYFCGSAECMNSIVAIGEGRHAHEQIIQSGWNSNAFVGSSLVDNV